MSNLPTIEEVRYVGSFQARLRTMTDEELAHQCGHLTRPYDQTQSTAVILEALSRILKH